MTHEESTEEAELHEGEIINDPSDDDSASNSGVSCDIWPMDSASSSEVSHEIWPTVSYASVLSNHSLSIYHRRHQSPIKSGIYTHSVSAGLKGSQQHPAKHQHLHGKGNQRIVIATGYSFAIRAMSPVPVNREWKKNQSCLGIFVFRLEPKTT